MADALVGAGTVAGSLASMVEKHENDLYRGNGKPGVVTRLALLEETLDKIAANLSKITWLALGTLATVGVDLIVRLVHR